MIQTKEYYIYYTVLNDYFYKSIININIIIN